MTAQAEIVIPNPLIKPQQITPMAESGADKSKALSMPTPGEAMALPRLPSAGAPGVPAAVDSDALRNTLSAYQVVLLSFDRATLKLATKQNSGAAETGPVASTRRNVSATIVVRNNGAFRFMGEHLRTRIMGDTVEILRTTPSGGGEDTVFIGSLEASSIPPYMPEISKLEKVDTQYIRSLTPEIRSSSSSGGSSNGGNSGPQGQASNSSSQ